MNTIIIKSLCNADNIYKLGVNLQKIIDLDKLVKKIDNLYNRSIVAFYEDKPVKSIVNDLNSIKDALNNYGKLFIQFGFFIYEDSNFIFDDHYVLEGIKYNSNFHQTQISTIISTSENLNDEYYDKYKYPKDVIGDYKHFVAGYGIYLDNDLNIESGYVTAKYSESPINSNIVDCTYHDFKDARDGDRIKEHIGSLINRADIWKTDDTPIVRKTDDVVIRGGRAQEEILKFLHNIKTELLYFINGKYFDIKQVDDILKELNEENVFIRDPIDGMSNRVLRGGEKLIFKITDDVGFYAYEKLEADENGKHYHDVLYVGKYPSDEEEILFDKEEYEKSDEDDYINIHEFKPKFTNISEVNQAIEGKKINLDKTMNRVRMPDFYNGPTVEEAGSGIYIHTVYVSERYGGDEIYEYEIDDDDFVTVEIQSGLGNYDLRLSPKYYTGDEAGDYGIYVVDGGEISFCENTGGMFGGINEIDDLSEPLNAFVIEILMSTIVFGDSIWDDGVMYCPDCGEDYHDGEESCPDCGTNLVTYFESYKIFDI